MVDKSEDYLPAPARMNRAACGDSHHELLLQELLQEHTRKTEFTDPLKEALAAANSVRQLKSCECPTCERGKVHLQTHILTGKPGNPDLRKKPYLELE